MKGEYTEPMSNNHHIPDGTTVRMGGKELVFGEHIVNLPDASSMLDDVETMRQ